MIARLGIFNSLSGEEWLDNVKLRVAPATRRMRGNLGSFWLQDRATGKVISLSFWESEEALRSNAPINATNTPLGPGQDPSKIPSPDVQEFYSRVRIQGDTQRHGVIGGGCSLIVQSGTLAYVSPSLTSQDHFS